MNKNNRIVKQTKKWLTSFIIQHRICPFAQREFDRETIQYQVVDEIVIEKQLEKLIYACVELDEHLELETTLVIFYNENSDLNNFDRFLDFLYLANQLIHKQGYEGIYQLASFHPEYCFEDMDLDDASNYTNRSPYPMLHLIREESLENVLLHYPDPESIPTRNVELTREMGLKVLQKILSDCY